MKFIAWIDVIQFELACVLDKVFVILSMLLTIRYVERQ
jgi:hypothetical protein